MIKATELRIGNLVYCYSYNQLVKVAAIYLWKEEIAIKTATEIQDGVYDRNINPIPLTEDWLKRFGANVVTENKDGSKNYWSKEHDFSVDVETHILANGIETLYRYRISGSERTIPLVHVHKLQNLHFELKGKELTLTPTK